MTNEQIQALKAAAIAVGRDGRTDDEWFHYLQCVHHKSILSLLAERDADKALIAELRSDVEDAEYRRDMTLKNSEALVARIAEMEASTLTVKLPEAVIDAICLTAAEIHNLGRGVSDDRAQEIIDSIRCAAGITLKVGGEDGTN